MNIQNGAPTLTGSAYPEKANELFYMSHPKVAKALLGLFLTEADAERGRIVMRSPDAMVTFVLVESVDDITHWHAVNNAFAGGGQRD